MPPEMLWRKRSEGFPCVGFTFGFFFPLLPLALLCCIGVHRSAANPVKVILPFPTCPYQRYMSIPVTQLCASPAAGDPPVPELAHRPELTVASPSLHLCAQHCCEGQLSPTSCEGSSQNPFPCLSLLGTLGRESTFLLIIIINTSFCLEFSLFYAH